MSQKEEGDFVSLPLLNRFRRDFHGRNGSLNDNIGRCFSHHLELLRFMMFRYRFLDISLIASQESYKAR